MGELMNSVMPKGENNLKFDRREHKDNSVVFSHRSLNAENKDSITYISLFVH